MIRIKHFFTTVTTQYDGYEWVEQAIVNAKDKKSAMKKVDKFDFTHDNGIEAQYPVNDLDLKEMTDQEYEVVNKFILTTI